MPLIVTIILQLLSIAFSGINAWYSAHDYQAYQAGAVEATVNGFYLPFSLGIGKILAGILGVIAAPKWQEILIWIRDRLPQNKPSTPGAAIQQLIDAANREVAENNAAKSRLLAMTLTGQTPPPFVPKTEAQQARDAALQKLATGVGLL